MLAKAARIFDVPTLFTTAFAERQALIEEIQATHPDQNSDRPHWLELLGR